MVKSDICIAKQNRGITGVQVCDLMFDFLWDFRLTLQQNISRIPPKRNFDLFRKRLCLLKQ